MAIPTLFAAATAATGAQLDADFQFSGILGAQPCAVVGTNSLTFTPASQSVGVPAYQSGLVVTGVSAAANTGSVVARIGPLPSIPVYYDGGTGPAALTGGEIQSGNIIVLVYDAILNGWHLINPPPSLALNAISTTQGVILYYNGTAWVALSPGTAGQVLETGGASANPAWKNFSAGSTSGTTSGISVTASPFTYTAGNQYETIYITGGTVSVIAVAGTTVFSASPATVRLAPGKAVVVTYSVAPTMAKTVD